MYIIGISGSPRKNGNTETLLDKMLEGFRNKNTKVEKVILNDLKMIPCQECEDVRDDGICKINDDFGSLFKKIMKADLVIIASPIFFGSLSAQTKILIDRFQCYWRYKYLIKKEKNTKKKKGIFISVEASDRDDFFNNAKAIVKNFFAVIDASYEGEVLCKGVDAKGAIIRKEDCLTKAFKLAKKNQEKT
jgi:multimeric flavodoxin WrbA